MAVIIKHCTCKSDFQDATYGKGNRVCNVMDKSGKKARCSVCGREIDV